MMIPKKLVVIAPHPDDETLGCGGTIARFAASGTEVSVLVVAGHLPPLYDDAAFETTHREALAAFKIMGVAQSAFLRIPATMVRDVPVAELNGKINGFIREIGPDMVLLPFPDRHIDHRIIFDACIVACRPVHAAAPKTVLAYETLSETHWNVPGIEPVFAPEFFVDTTDYMAKKNAARRRSTMRRRDRWKPAPRWQNFVAARTDAATRKPSRSCASSSRIVLVRASYDLTASW